MTEIRGMDEPMNRDSALKAIDLDASRISFENFESRKRDGTRGRNNGWGGAIAVAGNVRPIVS